MKRVLGIVSLLLCGPAANADDSSFNVDQSFDFSSAATFAFQTPQIDSRKAEISNRLFVQKMQRAMGEALVKKSLRETTNSPHLLVDFTLAVVDHSVVRPGASVDRTGPVSVLYTEGELVISVRAAATNAVVWRGTYRDEEPSGPRLAAALPRDAAELLSKFPRR